GPDFETGENNLGALMREIDADRKAHPDKSITLIRIADLARLVRIAPLKRLNLVDLRELFMQAKSPDEAAAWVDNLEHKEVEAAPYQAILEMVWQLQQEDKEHTIEYAALRTGLRMSGKLTISDGDLRR